MAISFPRLVHVVQRLQKVAEAATVDAFRVGYYRVYGRFRKDDDWGVSVGLF